MSRQIHYNSADHISAETAADPYLRPAFSLKNRIQRLIWNICWLIFYRTSPRPFHAWRVLWLRMFGATMGPQLPLLSRLQGPFPLESRLRGPGNRRRRRRDLQPRPAHPRLPRHLVPGRLHLRSHPRLRRPRLSTAHLRDGNRPLRLGVRTSLCRPRRQHRGRCCPWARFGSLTKPGSLDGVRGRSRRAGQRPQTPRLDRRTGAGEASLFVIPEGNLRVGAARIRREDTRYDCRRSFASRSVGCTGLARISNSCPCARAFSSRSAVAACPLNNRILQLGRLLRVAIAASIPVIPVMITSEINISGRNVSNASMAFSPLYTARASKPAWFRDNGKRIRDYLLVVGDKDARFRRCSGYCF